MRGTHGGPIALILLTLLLIVATASRTLADPQFPALNARVVDAANVIPADARARIEAKLKTHEQETSDQVVIATVPTLGDMSIEEYANRLFRNWGLGQKDKNNGVLVLVAPNDRKVKIETGYGLEGALTDAASSLIISKVMAPKFRKGDFAGGIDAAVDRIVDILSSDAAEMGRKGLIKKDAPDPFVTILPLLLLALLIYFVFARRGADGARYHRTRNGNWIVVSGGGWGGWGGSFGGGGFSEGGDFSGGGGSSGGGGASGSW
jgi:uncharacterized protein